jgi:hypothetical protein
MAVPIWPTSLPQGSLREGFEEDFPNNLLVSESDDGFSKTRNKGALGPIQFTSALYLTNAQRITFLNFVKFTLKNGALRYQHKHPFDDDTIEVMIVPQGEKLFTLSPYGLGWKVILKLKIMP